MTNDENNEFELKKIKNTIPFNCKHIFLNY